MPPELKCCYPNYSFWWCWRNWRCCLHRWCWHHCRCCWKEVVMIAPGASVGFTVTVDVRADVTWLVCSIDQNRPGRCFFLPSLLLLLSMEPRILVTPSILGNRYDWTLVCAVVDVVEPRRCSSSHNSLRGIYSTPVQSSFCSTLLASSNSVLTFPNNIYRHTC